GDATRAFLELVFGDRVCVEAAAAGGDDALLQHERLGDHPGGGDTGRGDPIGECGDGRQHLRGAPRAVRRGARGGPAVVRLGGEALDEARGGRIVEIDLWLCLDVGLIDVRAGEI